MHFNTFFSLQTSDKAILIAYTHGQSNKPKRTIVAFAVAPSSDHCPIRSRRGMYCRNKEMVGRVRIFLLNHIDYVSLKSNP